MKALLLFALLAIAASRNLRRLGITDGINKGCDYVNGIAKTYQNLCKAIGTYKSDTVKAMYEGLGFSRLYMKGTVKRGVGIMSKNWERWKQMNYVNFGIEKGSQTEELYNSYLDSDQDVDENIWGQTKIFFHPENKEKNFFRQLTLSTNHRDDGKTDAIVVNFDYQFELAPDLVVMKHERSYVGGAYQSDKDEIVRQPRNFKEDDLKALIAISELFTFKFLGPQLGIDTSATPEALK